VQNVQIVCPECNTLNEIAAHVESETIPCSTCSFDLDDPSVIEVDDVSCAKHIDDNSIPMFVDFYSTTCGPCMAMYDDYEDAAFGFSLKVRFLKINADEHQEIARKYAVTALPTIIAFKNGVEVNRISRQLSRVELTLWAESLL